MSMMRLPRGLASCRGSRLWLTSCCLCRGRVGLNRLRHTCPSTPARLARFWRQRSRPDNERNHPAGAAGTGRPFTAGCIYLWFPLLSSARIHELSARAGTGLRCMYTNICGAGPVGLSCCCKGTRVCNSGLTARHQLGIGPTDKPRLDTAHQRRAARQQAGSNSEEQRAGDHQHIAQQPNCCQANRPGQSNCMLVLRSVRGIWGMFELVCLLGVLQSFTSERDSAGGMRLGISRHPHSRTCCCAPLLSGAGSPE
jgi:hypothetical protein